MFVDLELQFNVPFVSPKFKKFAKEFNFFWDRVFRSQHSVMFNIQEAHKDRRDLKPFLKQRMSAYLISVMDMNQSDQMSQKKFMIKIIFTELIGMHSISLM